MFSAFQNLPALKDHGSPKLAPREFHEGVLRKGAVDNTYLYVTKLIDR